MRFVNKLDDQKQEFPRVGSLLNNRNLTPQKWLIRRRLEAAYIQLKEGRKVQDVYVDVGFKNPAHFSTAFKKRYGISPTEV